MIPGWMAPSELTWLTQRAQERQKIVEIGSYLGRSTKALALATPGIVYSVDDVSGYAVPIAPGHEKPWSGKALDTQFRQNLAAEIAAGKCVVIRKPSLEAADTFDEESVDMVFIDGDHSYDAVVADIAAWLPKLVPGGLLCGHDRPQVAQALAEAGIEGVGPERLWFHELAR